MKKPNILNAKQLQQIVDYRNEIDWSVWKRRIGSQRVALFITYGDTRELSKLVGINFDDAEAYMLMRSELRDYIKAKGLYKDDYEVEKATTPTYCKSCGQLIK